VKPLVLIYWTRVALAIVAAAISTVITLMFGERGINTFLNGITIALLVYLLTYYVFKAKFSSQIEKKSKIMSMGIGIYFFTWILVWVLMYTTAIALGFAPAA
jgi:hypothetical protein